MARAFTASIERAPALAAAVIAGVCVWLAVRMPVTPHEAYVFHHFVRFPLRDMLGVFDPAASLLKVVLLKRAVGLFRLSAFSLRVPDLAGVALYLWAVARLVRGRWLVIALVGILYPALEFFARGSGLGPALALWTCGAERAQNQPDRPVNLNQAGLCLGLSVAASFCFLVPSLLLAVWLAWRIRSPIVWAERLFATAVVAGFIPLVLPYSHASPRELLHIMLPPPMATGPLPASVAGVAARLERETHGQTVRIAAPAEVVPMLEFYKARDRQAGWRISSDEASADYRVAYRGADVALVRQGP